MERAGLSSETNGFATLDDASNAASTLIDTSARADALVAEPAVSKIENAAERDCEGLEQATNKRQTDEETARLTSATRIAQLQSDLDYVNLLDDYLGSNNSPADTKYEDRRRSICEN